MCITVRRVDEHGHAPDEKVVRRGIILKNMMTTVLDNQTVPVRRFYDTTVDVDLGHSEDLPSFESVRTRVKRYRAHFIPPIPTEIDDVLTYQRILGTHVEGSTLSRSPGQQLGYRVVYDEHFTESNE